MSPGRRPVINRSKGFDGGSRIGQGAQPQGGSKQFFSSQLVRVGSMMGRSPANLLFTRIVPPPVPSLLFLHSNLPFTCFLFLGPARS